ncbi:MAG: hypothetical protein IJA32_06645 [Lachnospiraceae bacterium]|nr:hypothetical protein [Lachnospiraceae bacterium]
MEDQEYKEISPELLEQAFNNAWSIENMDSHKKEQLEPEYMGSCTKGNRIYDYYRDNSGGWWYRNRGIVDGNIASMDVYIFGKELAKNRNSKKKH